MRTSVNVETTMRFRLLLVVAIGILAGCNDSDDSLFDAVVTGNSMAPAFWGEHVEGNCEECGYAFRVGEQPSVLPDRLVCPNCGDRSVDSTKVKPRSAHRVGVVPCHKSEGALKLARWDVVAVRASGDRPAMIKRVIGLPGESIEFVDGDVFANGSRVRKPLDVAAAMRVPVFDSQFSSADVLRRFRPQGNAKGWRVDQGVWKYLPSSQSAETQWLAYEQWRCVSSSRPRDHVVSVEDWYATNANMNRNLNATDDIWARIELGAMNDGRVAIAVDLGAKVYTYEIDFGARQVSLEGRRVSFDMDDSKPRSATADGASPFRIDVCTFDRQLALMVNGRLVETIDWASPDGPDETGDTSQSLSMIRIGGRGEPLSLERFQLWRDVYYFDEGVRTQADRVTRLTAGSNEYLLVGDNVPMSIDCRHWPTPAVSGDEILGSVELFQ